MSEKQSSNATKMVVSALAGAVVGAVTALLLAPKSGKELRSDISEKYHEATEKSKEIASQVTQKSKDIAKAVQEKGKELVQTVSEQTSQLVENAKSVKDAVKDEIHSLRSASEAAAAKEQASEEDEVQG